MKKTAVLGLIFVLIAFILPGCSLPYGADQTGDEIEPGNGSSSGAISSGPGAGSAPTATHTLLPTFTATLAAPMVSVSVNTNCRLGPGSAYDYKGGLLVGETAVILGRDESGQFWVIRNPDNPDELCWIWGQYASVAGDWHVVPVATAPPTPTPTKPPSKPQPYFSFAFKDITQCVSIYGLKFTVTNMVNMTWESYSLYTKDLTTSEEYTSTGNRFADCEACGCESYRENLPPGQSDTAGTVPYLHHAPHGDAFYAHLTLCTQDNGQGDCHSREINFTVP